MGESTRIPADEFASALADLDADDLAAFVGELWSGTAEAVTVDPPFVSARKGNEQIRLVAVTSGSELTADTGDVDAVVTADEAAVGGHGLPVVGPADLRQRLLYGLSPGEADAICEQFLDTPARSPSYAPGSSVGEPAPDSRPGGQRVEPAVPGRPGTWLETLARRSGSRVAVALVLALLVLSAGGVAVYVGGQGGDGDGRTVTDGTPTPAPSEPGGGTAVTDGTPTPAPSVTNATEARRVVDGDETERDWREVGTQRYAGLEPTCNRSYLHVVQIQMNALKYNDPATDDGIRTVRRFASPRNREAVGSFERFVEIIESQAYAPMLSYDSVTYAPARTDDDDARVRVTTRANGTVTGRYEFRLRRQDGGEYDGCWMTDGVQSSTSGSDPGE